MDEEKVENIELEEELRKFEEELNALMSETDEEAEATPLFNTEEQEEGETALPHQEKKGDLSKAVKEKNRKIKELKQKIADYEARLASQSVNTQPVEGEKQASATSPAVNSEEIEVAVKKINEKCDEIKEKYKNAKYPFRKGEVLLELYKKTGGYIEDLGLIEDTYLAMLHRKELQERELDEKRRSASTETPTAQASGDAYEPKTLEEGFNLAKKFIKGG